MGIFLYINTQNILLHFWSVQEHEEVDVTHTLLHHIQNVTPYPIWNESHLNYHVWPQTCPTTLFSSVIKDVKNFECHLQIVDWRSPCCNAYRQQAYVSQLFSIHPEFPSVILHILVSPGCMFLCFWPFITAYCYRTRISDLVISHYYTTIWWRKMSDILVRQTSITSHTVLFTQTWYLEYKTHLMPTHGEHLAFIHYINLQESYN
jgi:hypothetical protein